MFHLFNNFTCSNFDFQALATFCAGLMAVSAAIMVGNKQHKILQSQTDLENSKLKADLFDRRMDTFHTTAKFILNISKDIRINEIEELYAQFNLKMHESNFLFSDSKIYNFMEDLWDFAQQMRTDVNIQNYGKKDIDRDKRIEKGYKKQKEYLKNLHDIFKDDLSIINRSMSK